MVQSKEKVNHEWSDAPTVPIKPDRYSGDAPTWPIASPPPSAGQRVQSRQVSDTRQPYAPVSPTIQPWFIRRGPALICLICTFIEVLIAIRVMLKLLGANPAAAFTSLVYALSAIFVAPFQGIFPSPSGYGSVLELSAAFAIPIYALLARLGVSIARIIRDKRPKPHS